MNHYLHFTENETEKIVRYCGFCKFKDLKKSQEVYFEIVQGVPYHHPRFIEEETEAQSAQWPAGINIHSAAVSAVT